MILWATWNAHNKLSFEGIKQKPQEIIQFSMIYLEEFSLDQKAIHPPLVYRREVEEGWHPLQEGWVRVNVDGAFKRSTAGAGMVIRDHLWEVQAAMAINMENILDAGSLVCNDFSQGFRV